MRKSFIVLFMFLFMVLQSLTACTTKSNSPRDENISTPTIREPLSQDSQGTLVEQASKIVADGTTLLTRVLPPEGFERVEIAEESFGSYLRKLPVKPHGAKVLYYDGREKKRDVHEAVIDIDVGDRDLQQCADAVIRLKAEYLYGQGLYDKISFNFTNGFSAQYSKWMEGYRISVDHNNVSWVKRTNYSNDYIDFRKYLDMVFAYAGTLSLSQELKKVSIEDMEIGDVFIQGGSPGHCVIVVDIVENKSTGEKLFMLAQSYMPAQDIHILKNTEDKDLSPWYSLNFGEDLLTPEWRFGKDDLKRFQ
ncbi:hypothetical protein CLFO_26130 [Clostridium formicaceticum]|uniref:DUF4846 domain-containing protein n=2 Tax=Clostridium formicaceticum TaxID=1497 RepID=A0AAC9WGQ3_9CLOT|nr:DUF4846 domain-containing protein [Clostridium formicaceticum]AOY78449.1 hypothetical protein BJL90_18270 [Clostridium formicaceticum]ARE88212.1 hypothetical protein CLFO_26130 [Clostridium formicaceticum]